MCASFIQVQTVVADVKGRGQKEWHLTLFVGKPLPVCAGGLLQMVELAHRFMCMTSPHLELTSDLELECPVLSCMYCNYQVESIILP